VKKFLWEEMKNEWLKKHGKISFEAIVEALTQDGLVDVLDNTSRNHSGQSVLVVELKQYFYIVPFRETGTEVFLNTVIPSRKMKKKYGVKP
jgi:uncharacterized DUF497 family protein